jgi:hypothetical protein
MRSLGEDGGVSERGRGRRRKRKNTDKTDDEEEFSVRA